MISSQTEPTYLEVNPVVGPIARDKSEISYRPDIDGLRAVAVLLVLFCHLELPHMRGGYVGVDIFFVISGYLITGNIAKLLAADRFSLAGFYERRFRRILPALAVMLVATSVLATLIFLPEELIGYGHSLLAAFFSYSNLHLYWTHSGYFGVTYTQILLHTWSLGVEEQFYLFIPLCMLLVARKPRLLRGMTLVVGAISFLVASYFAFRNPDLAFYMPYTRAWELLSGSLVSLGMLPLPGSCKMRECMLAVSFVLIAICVVFYNPTVPFPGAAALLPCLAAVMILLAGEAGTTFLGRVLSLRPMVYVGLISYSLYLWHWPLVVLVRLGAIPGIREKTVLGDLFIAVFSIFLASLSWRFVERPFRAGRFRRLSRRRIFELAGVCAGVVLAVAILLQARQGFPERFPAAALALGQYLKAPSRMRSGTCFVETAFSDFDRSNCLKRGTGTRNVLLLGDSHAAALWWGLQDRFPEVNFLQATMAACPPTEGKYKRSNCSQMRRFIYQSYLPETQLDAVILTQRWTSIQDLDRMDSALRWFQSRQIPVTVVGPVPEYTAPLPFLLAFGLKRRDPALAARNKVIGLEEVDRQLRIQLRGRPGVAYASAWDAVCPGGACNEYASGVAGVPLLSDVDHLTEQGSIEVVGALKNAGELVFR